MTFRKTFRALFLPTDGVLKIDYIPFTPGGENSKKIPADKDMIKALYQYTADAMIWENGRPLTIPRKEIHPVYGKALFFPARGSYTLLFTCNNWTSRGLKQAGIGTHLWTPLAWHVNGQI